jgi:hypothetical protein
MKKLFLTAALLIGFAMGTYAQIDPFEEENENEVIIFNSLLHRSTQEMSPQFGNYGWRDGGTFSLCLPGHNFTTHWNGGSQGHDHDLLPLGNGALLLIGFGAAYALSKRKKKD